MITREDPRGARDGGDLAGLRAEALDVVLDARTWRLPIAKWQVVARWLATMQAALESGDPQALAEATVGLAVVSPLRTTMISSSHVPPAPPVYDLLTRLVHSLGGVGVNGQAPGGDAAPDDDDN